MRKIWILLAVMMLVGCAPNDSISTENKAVHEIGAIGSENTVTRAEAAKMLALMKYSINNIELMDREIKFEDTDIENWWDKYINAAYKSKMMSGTTDKTFEPESYLSLEQAQFLLNKLDTENTLKIKYEQSNKDKPISYAMWAEVLQRVKSDIKQENIVVLATGSQCDELGERYIITDKGLYSADGMDIATYYGNELKVLAKENEIIALLEVISNEPVLNNVEVSEVQENKVKIKVSGCDRYFLYEKGDIVKGEIVNIQISGDTILQVTKSDTEQKSEKVVK